ncbi:MAG: hypothetical protein V4615_09495 [Bacteroidota bacterium]
MKNKTILLNTLLIALFSITLISGCKKEDDDDGNGIPANTLVAAGTNINMAGINCGPRGSGDFGLTANDVSNDNILDLRFGGSAPATTTTFPLSPSGSSSDAWGTYTVNGSLVYEIQSGNANYTPGSNGKFIITFTGVLAEASNGSTVTLSFNGTCN